MHSVNALQHDTDIFREGDRACSTEAFTTVVTPFSHHPVPAGSSQGQSLSSEFDEVV